MSYLGSRLPRGSGLLTALAAAALADIAARAVVVLATLHLLRQWGA